MSPTLSSFPFNAPPLTSTNLTVSQSPSRVSPDQLPALPPHEELAPEKIDSSIDKWFFISGASA